MICLFFPTLGWLFGLNFRFINDICTFLLFWLQICSFQTASEHRLLFFTGCDAGFWLVFRLIHWKCNTHRCFLYYSSGSCIIHSVAAESVWVQGLDEQHGAAGDDDDAAAAGNHLMNKLAGVFGSSEPVDEACCAAGMRPQLQTAKSSPEHKPQILGQQRRSAEYFLFYSLVSSQKTQSTPEVLS